MNYILGTVSKEIVSACQQMASAGLVSGTWGNASSRLKDDKIIITPSGIPYNLLTPVDMTVLDISSGQVIEGKRRPSTEYTMHMEIYRQRQDVHAIMHTHSIYASTLAAARREIPPLLEEQAQLVGGKILTAEYAPAGTEDLAWNAVKALGNRNAVLLANHGLVGVGRDIKEAFLVCQVAEKACMVYLASKCLGDAVALSEEEVQALRNTFLTEYGQK
ncbi:MAG: class II aldolase/adducin family protein [Clostridiales bacterium]|nr:class II aldolase/adducin family protein [Clostridiales bacterium]MCF8022601.1 class II aldolase/adducin family protein [Clostridiales bacterium]